MPEGDTVWRACRRLHQALAGQELTRTDFRVPALATTDLSGRTVLEVVARGKHLLMRVSGGITIHSHLRMDGSWHVYRPGERWRGGPGHQIRAVLETSPTGNPSGSGRTPDAGGAGGRSSPSEPPGWATGAGTAGSRSGSLGRVGGAGPGGGRGGSSGRGGGGGWVVVGYRLPVLEVVATDAEDTVVGHLGPDLLAPDFDRELAMANLAREPERTISEALLDQRNLAGIGNFYRTEVCFLLGLHPWRPVGTVDLGAAVDLSRRMLKANLNQATQVSTGVNRPGERTWVFERAGKACRRCGTRIQTAPIGEAPRERVSYWCPRCQPELA